MMATADLLRVFVVDDEAPARRKLLRLLRNESNVEVVGEADNAEAAIAAIEKQRPDLVFVDVQMPGADGFDVVRAISANGESRGSAATRFVFVTAHDQYAVRAFEVHAFDYLLKPVGEERFREVLRRAQEQHQRNGDVSEKRLRGLIDQVLRDRGFPERLLIREESRAYFVNVREISWVEAERNYLILHCGAKSHTMRGTLDSIEEHSIQNFSRGSIAARSFVSTLFAKCCRGSTESTKSSSTIKLSFDGVAGTLRGDPSFYGIFDVVGTWFQDHTDLYGLRVHPP